jgi:hypothetical protein
MPVPQFGIQRPVRRRVLHRNDARPAKKAGSKAILAYSFYVRLMRFNLELADRNAEFIADFVTTDDRSAERFTILVIAKAPQYQLPDKTSSAIQ